MAALLGASSMAEASAGQPDQSIVGLWRSVATITGVPPSPQFNLFGPGGTVISVPPTTQARSIGIGHWLQSGDREYDVTFWIHRFTETGALAGGTKFLSRLILGETGDTYTGAFKSTLYDVSGAVTGSGMGTLEGTRLNPEPFA
jgi:hypothetical protein